MNMKTSQSTAESTSNQTSLDTFYDLNNTLVTEGNCYMEILEARTSIFIHLNPKPILPEAIEQNQTNSGTKSAVVFAGNGDFILDDSILKYLEHLRIQGKAVESLTLSEIEISAKLLHSLLTILKPILKALCISRVPLDNEHLEIINNLQLNLEFLSICYTETDQRHTFGNQQNQNQEAYKPFDINKLDLQRLSSGLKYLELQGLTLKKKTFDTFVDNYSETLEILKLEDLKSGEESKKEFFQHILQNIFAFKNLKGLSLMKNNLDSINFNEFESEEEQDGESEEQEDGESKQNITFPQNLQALNLKFCNLKTKQVKDLVEVLTKSNCGLTSLHLEGSYLYQRALEAISKYSKTSCPTGSLLLEISKPPIDPSGRNNLQDSKSKAQTIQLKVNDNFEELLQNSTILENIENSTTKPEWASQFLKHEGGARALSYALKLLGKIKSFNDAYLHQVVDFKTNPKMLIPKHNFNELLNYIAKESNKELLLGESSFVGEYDSKLIRKIHPKLTKDDDWAKLPLKDQRRKFLELMKNLGYQHIEKKHKDCYEDQFVMALKTLKHVSYDYTLSTFSLFWYYNQVSVKFNLSDDWYLDRKQRMNRYALPNQDFLISFCSEWNIHTNEYIFELDIEEEGESEIKFKTSIWKDGDLNVARALLIAIDKGFVMLKALHKIELFDKGDVFKGVEDSKKVRRVLKQKLRKYIKSQDFQNLLRQEKNDLGEPEEEVEGEQQ